MSGGSVPPLILPMRTSKDIDFYGNHDQVRRCAELLGGTHRLYSRKDRTPACGVITTADGLQIDILHTLAGVTPYAVVDRAVELDSVRVMHPIHVMASRVANVSDLCRTDAHALRQLRAAAFVVREHTREALDFGAVEEAYELNEAAFFNAHVGEIQSRPGKRSSWRAQKTTAAARL
jgi:hypothetical protein